MEVSDQFVLFPRPLLERARVRDSKNYAYPHLNPLPSETVSQFIEARKIAQRGKIICQVMGSI
jgi:hypothetical protein